MDQKYTWWNPLKVLLVMVAFLIMTANLMAGSYYLNRIYPGIKIAGVKVGGLTRKEARHRLEERLRGYKIEIVLDQQHFPLEPERVGVVYDIESTLDEAWTEGRSVYPPIYGLLQGRRSSDLRFAYSVDRTKLQEFVNVLTASQSQSPIDASIVILKGEPKVEPDKSGQGIDGINLSRVVEGAFEKQVTTVSIQRQVLPAKIKAADLEETLSATKKLLSIPLRLAYNDKTFGPNQAVMGEWLAFTKVDGQPKTTVEPAKMEAYLRTVAAAIYVAPKNHLINTQNGTVTSEEPGVDGLEIDKEGLRAAITAAMNGISDPNITIQAHAIAFKTVYNRTISLDFGRYIEINLSTQHLWAYQDHKVIFESAITSGATGAGYGTVTGLFDIKAKQRDRNLNGYAIGYSYNVFVQYWMPFFGNFGMHDASWRNSFGGQDYYYAGSHGCVNLPIETAAWIYNWAEVGTPVWVHT